MSDFEPYTWRGQPFFSCGHCAADAPSEELIVEHLAAEHGVHVEVTPAEQPVEVVNAEPPPPAQAAAPAAPPTAPAATHPSHPTQEKS